MPRSHSNHPLKEGRIVNRYQRNALIVGAVVAVLATIAFVSQPSTQYYWSWDPVGMVVMPAVIGAAIDGAVAYVIAYVIGRLLARRQA